MLWWKGNQARPRFRKPPTRVELHLFHFGLEVTVLQPSRARLSTVIIYIISLASCSEPLSPQSSRSCPAKACNSPQISDLQVYL